MAKRNKKATEVVESVGVEMVETAVVTSTPSAADAVMATISLEIDAKIEAAHLAGNSGLANKWANEKAAFLPLVPTIVDNGLDAGSLVPNAIYATQKVTKLLRAVALGDPTRVDAYTRTILHNGQRVQLGNVIPNRLANASLSKWVEGDFGDNVERRLARHTTTASTQASSSRKALEAVGMGSVADRTLHVKWDTPLGMKVQALLGYGPAELEEPDAEDVAEVGSMEPPVGTGDFAEPDPSEQPEDLGTPPMGVDIQPEETELAAVVADETTYSE